MKKIILLSFIFLLSCSTEKTLVEDKIITKETLILSEIHDHYYYKDSVHCMYVEKQTFIRIDTINIEKIDKFKK